MTDNVVSFRRNLPRHWQARPLCTAVTIPDITSDDLVPLLPGLPADACDFGSFGRIRTPAAGDGLSSRRRSFFARALYVARQQWRWLRFIWIEKR